MKEKQILYFGADLLALFVSFALALSRAYDQKYIVIGLFFGCAFTAKLLVQRVSRFRRLDALLLSGCAGVCFVLGPEQVFPLFALLLLELSDLLAGWKMLAQLASVLIALAFLLFPCSFVEGVLTAAVLLPVFFARLLVERLTACRDRLDRQKNENKLLSDRLADNRRLMKTLQYAARLEERNRLATRIHDKIGHGVSGSIILLEGAMLTMEQNPRDACKTVDCAVENLRESVDEIRMALRSERPTRSEAGRSEIELELARFSDAHPVRTEFRPSGRVDELPGYLWNCLYENLLEALTNLLKHSNATAFTFKLHVANKIARAEFRDNGRAAPLFDKGIGLESIEERVVLNAGRCFFESGPTGFVITQIFMME